MCLPKPKDPSAEIASSQAASARQQEAERQARVDAGRASIDTAFSQFGDDYYNKIGEDYKAYYNPQVDEQYEKTREKLIYELARGSTLESDAATKRLEQLEKKYKDNQAMIGNQAVAASNEARGRVESERSNLVNLNLNAADPAVIGERASASAANVSAPPTYSTLGNLFADVLNQGATGLTLEAKGYPGFSSGFPKINYGSTGSGYVVRGP